MRNGSTFLDAPDVYSMEGAYIFKDEDATIYGKYHLICHHTLHFHLFKYS